MRSGALAANDAISATSEACTFAACPIAPTSLRTPPIAPGHDFLFGKFIIAEPFLDPRIDPALACIVQRGFRLVDEARGFVLGGLVRTTVGRRGCCENWSSLGLLRDPWGAATPCQEQVGPKQARSRPGTHPNFTGGASTPGRALLVRHPLMRAQNDYCAKALRCRFGSGRV